SPLIFNYLFVEQTVFSEKNSVDWSGRREDSCGSTVQGRPRRRWKRRGGSPNRPRKAKRLERKSTDLFNEVITNNISTY
ncbi:MAG: hypothetical protein Q8898_02545, partial [Bacillota bacterium]|nr:hypothetical protein [Bacillota bacterium]